MPIRQLCANLLIPNRLCFNLPYSPLAALELYVKKTKTKYYENFENNKNKIDDLFHNKENGYHIGQANHWFGYFYSCYPGFLAFVLVGFTFKYFGGINVIIIMLTISLPIGLCYFYAYNAVFKEEHYLKYYKQFEKENKQWHRKWKMITMAFCIGGIMAIFLGIVIVWLILLS